jgi:hypothetical protein
MENGTPQEHNDVLAEHRAWSRTAEILAHWAEASRLIGLDELTQVMDRAEADALRQMDRTLDALEAFGGAPRQTSRGGSMTEHPEMRNTVFGEVLASLLEARGLEVSPFKVGKLAEEAGLDGWKVIGRMADAGVEDAGYLDGLAGVLGLSESEKIELAFAYTFERREGKGEA